MTAAGSPPTERLQELPYTGDPSADRLLVENPLALLIGFVLDQQFPIQRAFASPSRLQQRIGELSVARVLELPLPDLEEAFATPPALHRYPRMMADRVRQLCELLLQEHQGRPELVWETAASADELRRRLESLPGIGAGKARVMIGVLGRWLEVRPRGWSELVPDHPSLADVGTSEGLERYQAEKRALKRRQRPGAKPEAAR